MINRIGVVLVAGMASTLAACSKEAPTAGAAQPSAAATGYRSVQPLAVTHGLSSGAGSDIYVNLGYRDEGEVRLGFMPASGGSGGRIFCPTMVRMAINAGDAIDVSTVPSENPGLYDDLVLGIRYRGRTCPQ